MGLCLQKFIQPRKSLPKFADAYMHHPPAVMSSDLGTLSSFGPSPRRPPATHCASRTEYLLYSRPESRNEPELPIAALEPFWKVVFAFGEVDD